MDNIQVLYAAQDSKRSICFRMLLENFDKYFLVTGSRKQLHRCNETM